MTQAMSNVPVDTEEVKQANYQLINKEDILKIDVMQEKIACFTEQTGRVLFEREEHSRIIALSLFAAEHIFIYGPSVTAKSAILSNQIKMKGIN